MNITKFQKQYLSNLENTISPNSVIRYRRYLDQFISFLILSNLTIERLNSEGVRIIIKAMVDFGYSRITIDRCLLEAKKFYNYLIENGIDNENPLEGVSRFVIKRKISKLPTSKQIDEKVKKNEIINAIRLRNFVMLQFYDMLNITHVELTNILLIDLTPDLKFLNTRNSIGEERTIALNNDVIISLRKFISHRANKWPSSIHLFPNEAGLKLSKASVPVSLNRAFNTCKGLKNDRNHPTFNYVKHPRRDVSVIPMSGLFTIWDHAIKQKINITILRDIVMLICYKTLETINSNDIKYIKLLDLSLDEGTIRIDSKPISWVGQLPQELISILRKYCYFLNLFYPNIIYLFPNKSGRIQKKRKILGEIHPTIIKMLNNFGYTSSVPVSRPEDLTKIITSPFNFQQLRAIKDIAIVECFYGSGIKSWELCNLELTDFSIANQGILVRAKQIGILRFVPLPKTSIDAIARFIEVRNVTWPASNFLFPNMKGGKISDISVYAIMKRTIGDLGLETKGSEIIRKAYIYHLMDAGIGVVALRELLNIGMDYLVSITGLPRNGNQG